VEGKRFSDIQKEHRCRDGTALMGPREELLKISKSGCAAVKKRLVAQKFGLQW
jgi:hypothetical protein